jgi:D-sedoheptulose 7-phosphate isomerase
MVQTTGPGAPREGAPPAASPPEEDGESPELVASSREELHKLVAAYPELRECVPAMMGSAAALVRCWRSGGTLYLCGNGGSHADALHVAGELVKSFERPRPLAPGLREALADLPHGDELAAALQAGLPTVTLGSNGAVATAIANDIALPGGGFAQELVALGRPGDVLLAISTSGTARNTVLATVVAKAIGMRTIALVGRGGEGPGAARGAGGDVESGGRRRLAGLADLAIVAPAFRTADVQAWHVRLYHCLCGMVEAEIFGG